VGSDPVYLDDGRVAEPREVAFSVISLRACWCRDDVGGIIFQTIMICVKRFSSHRSPFMMP
jgi:hypothetical protein